MINVHIGITYCCNMNCAHCYIKEKERKKPAHVEADRLLERLESLGTFYITYTMAENLLCPSFWQFAEKAKQRGFYQILLSNGSTINDMQTVDRLQQVGIKCVGISLDHNDSAIHDRNRGYPGAYEGALQALRLLAQSYVRPQMTVTISEQNLNVIPALIDIGRNIGVTSFSFLWLRKDGIIAPVTDWDSYREMMRFLVLRKVRDGLDINTHDFRMEPLLCEMLHADELSQEAFEDIHNMNVCHAYDDLILIDPAGDMYQCNFCQKPFANIYTADTAALLAGRPQHKPLCEETRNNEI